MPTIVLPVAANGFSVVKAGGTSWPPAYVSRTVGPFLDDVTVDTTKNGPSYFWDHVLLRFNAELLPSDITVESATLTFRHKRKSTPNDTDGRNVVAEFYDPGTITDSGDYDSTPGVNAIAGHDLSTVVSQASGTNVSIPLVDLSGIVGGGVIGLRLYIEGGQPTGTNRFGIDVSTLTQTSRPPLIDPNTGQEILLFNNLGHSVSYSFPTLTVTYSEGAPPAPGSGSGATPEGLPTSTSAARTEPRTFIPWQIFLCDLRGVPIANLTHIGFDRGLAYRLNRPSSLSFRVPSDHKAVSAIHTDGEPLLSPLVRTVKAYRREVLEDGSELWVLRFAGHVLQVEDVGTASAAFTSVVCFDPLQRLWRRITDGGVTFTDVSGSSILRQLIDTANGKYPTGVITDGGVFEDTLARTITYTYSRIGEAMNELTNAVSGFDIQVLPIDRQDGSLAQIHAFAALGQLQPSVVFGWGIAPHNVRDVRRLVNGDIVVNSLLALGGNGNVSRPTSETSINRYGLLEEVSSYNDITNMDFLNDIANEELHFRSQPREWVEIVPQPGKGWEPFTHVRLGDTFYVYAGERLRGGFAGIQRCYGFDISIDSNGIESVSRFVTAPED